MRRIGISLFLLGKRLKQENDRPNHSPCEDTQTFDPSWLMIDDSLHNWFFTIHFCQFQEQFIGFLFL